ncbi:zinc-ribbon domain-containing protein [Nioella nitratireducens]|uniref:zinc-ribbon domain-containing protein n=1 Tax=Nioella nitratireducens TaxID=1287720 RepID=UPI0008FCF53F|nr:zinc-ribbon domain-containing protein [Nioella nitratireducens]
MRLTCPNCSARYEVDDTLIPPEGRDVQCSNCATTWFQPGNRAPVEESGTSRATAEVTSRRNLDPDLKDIFREEREREERLRRAAAETAAVEEQEEMALDSAPEPAPSHGDTPPQETTEDEELAAIREAVDESTQAQNRPPRRELLPDIEEINSTLRATSDRNAQDFDTSDIESMDVIPRRRRGFRMGFILMVILAAGAVGTYSYAPEIAAAVPQAEPTLASYVETVNQLRFQLDDLVQGLAGQLTERSGS